MGILFQLDPGSVLDANVNSAARISASKLQNAFVESSDFGQSTTGTPVTTTRRIRVPNNAGIVSSVRALLNNCGTAASMTVDLFKNGVSILTAPITLSNTTGNNIVVAAAIATTAFNTGDYFDLVLTVTTSTGAQGPFAWVGFLENGAP